MALFPADREAPELDCEVVRIELNALRLRRARQWGACWLALTVWERLELDRFWRSRLPVSRQGTRWLDVLKTQVCYQLIDPGSEWRLHRHWYEHSAMGDLLGRPAEVVCGHTLYRCLDKLLIRRIAARTESPETGKRCASSHTPASQSASARCRSRAYTP